MTIFTDKVTKYMPRLMSDLQITKVQAAGIFGNIGTETGGFSALQEKKPIAGRGGYGWLQWTGPRRKAYEQWCKDKNLDPSADETNYQYIVYETLHSEAHSLVQLKKTTTIEAAAETFMKQNLRPGKPNLPSRISYAKIAFDTHQGDSVTSKASTTAVVVGTGAVVATTQASEHISSHWYQGPLWIAAIALGVVAVTWFVIHLYHKSEAELATKGK